MDHEQWSNRVEQRGDGGVPTTRRRLLRLAGATGLGVTASLVSAGSARANDLAVRRVPNGLATTTIATLRAGTNVVDPEGYYVIDPGKEGLYLADPADTASPDDTGTVIVTASGQRYKRVIETDWVDVAWFGAVGDGHTDDTAAIRAADAAAAALGKRLVFPAGVYMQYGAPATTSWASFDGAVIKNNQPTSDKYGFCHVVGVKSVTFEGLCFDGSVSDDPATWTSANYNSFTGAVAFFVSSSTAVTLVDCEFRDSFMAPLRIEKCTDVTIRDCRVSKGRGSFGDGIYLVNSHDVLIERCHISDYTRIGVVGESSSSGITVVDTRVENGHDGSIAYGGTEYNAGFWFENSANLRLRGCHAQDNTSYGVIVVQTASSPQDVVPSPTLIEQCVVVNSEFGFRLSGGYSGAAIWAVCRDSAFYGTDDSNTSCGFVATGKDPRDSLTFSNCYAQLTGGSDVYSTGFFVNRVTVEDGAAAPKVTVADSTVEWVSQRPDLLSDPARLYADVLLSAVASGTVSVDRLTTVGSDAGSVVKVVDAGAPRLRFRDSLVGLRVVADFASLEMSDCEITAVSGAVGSSSTAGQVSITGGVVQGPLKVQTSGAVRLDGVRIAPAEGTRVDLVGGNGDGVRAEFHACQVRKDVASGGPAIGIDDPSGDAVTVFSGCTFDGASESADGPFVAFANPSARPLFAGCFSDSLVANVVQIGSALSTPEGVSAVL
jgi:hypothetical protein